MTKYTLEQFGRFQFLKSLFHDLAIKQLMALGDSVDGDTPPILEFVANNERGMIETHARAQSQDGSEAFVLRIEISRTDPADMDDGVDYAELSQATPQGSA